MNQTIRILTIAAITLKSTTELILLLLNKKETLRYKSKKPYFLDKIVTEEAYLKSIPYTLEKNSFAIFSSLFQTTILLSFLFSGILPFLYQNHTSNFGISVLSQAFFLFFIAQLLSFVAIPLDIYETFHIEQKYGFNKTTIKLWIIDFVKSFLIGAIITIPLITLLLFITEKFENSWWLLGFALIVVFQLLLFIIYPQLIMPIFNKFSPLPEGALKERLFKLTETTKFLSSDIFVMDGSKRSSHSNAFFTGFGKFRRIVFFDTLLNQLNEEEIEAILAHEIGHYKKKHILKQMIFTILFLFISFYTLFQITKIKPFLEAFNLTDNGTNALYFLLFALLGSTATFWLTPIMSFFSRKNEFEADAFAANAVGGSESLKSGLIKLSEKNLSNFTPNRLYSNFYYSHPKLTERLKALD